MELSISHYIVRKTCAHLRWSNDIFAGNLHFNVTSATYSRELHELIEPFVYDYVADCRGSISAEHGLGFAKHKYIHHSKSKAAVDMMLQMKQLFDPKGILNPYKTLPQP